MDYLKYAQDYYNSINYSDPDPRTKNWLLVNDSPWQVHCLSLAYLAFVYIGTKVMKHRKAFDLKSIMIIYNFSLVLLSIYMLVEIWQSAVELKYGVSCAPYNKNNWKNPLELRMANVLWWYFFSKAIELIDTVLMILRRKNNQVTFLHVFHHVSMLNIWWRVMMYIPGGLSYFGSCINCAVHVVMYTYYGLSVIPSLRKHLWWKKYLTMLQLIQFVISFIHTCSSVLVQCDFPSWAQHMMFWYMIIMMVLFSNFYVHAYILHKNKFDPNNYSSKELLAHMNDGVCNGSTKKHRISNDNLVRPSLHELKNGGKMLNGHVEKKTK